MIQSKVWNLALEKTSRYCCLAAQDWAGPVVSGEGRHSRAKVSSDDRWVVDYCRYRVEFGQTPFDC